MWPEPSTNPTTRATWPTKPVVVVESRAWVTVSPIVGPNPAKRRNRPSVERLRAPSVLAEPSIISGALRPTQLVGIGIDWTGVGGVNPPAFAQIAFVVYSSKK